MSRTRQRYDGCTPMQAERIRTERETVSRWLAWAAIAAVVVAFGQGFI